MFKKGDIVKLNSSIEGSYVISRVDSDPNTFDNNKFVFYLEKSGNRDKYVYENMIELDKQYYRNKNIDVLLGL